MSSISDVEYRTDVTSQISSPYRPVVKMISDAWISVLDCKDLNDDAEFSLMFDDKTLEIVTGTDVKFMATLDSRYVRDFGGIEMFKLPFCLIGIMSEDSLKYSYEEYAKFGLVGNWTVKKKGCDGVKLFLTFAEQQKDGRWTMSCETS